MSFLLLFCIASLCYENAFGEVLKVDKLIKRTFEEDAWTASQKEERTIQSLSLCYKTCISLGCKYHIIQYNLKKHLISHIQLRRLFDYEADTKKCTMKKTTPMRQYRTYHPAMTTSPTIKLWSDNSAYEPGKINTFISITHILIVFDSFDDKADGQHLHLPGRAGHDIPHQKLRCWKMLSDKSARWADR